MIDTLRILLFWNIQLKLDNPNFCCVNLDSL